MAEWMKEREMLREQTVDWKDLVLRENGITCGSIQADHAIFCDGYRSMHNPWFDWLPFAPDQGEILTLKRVSDQPLPDRIINGATWLLPVDHGRYRLGATHYHDRQDNQPTESGKERLLEGMEKLLRHPQALELESNDAGVRPATADRQPFIGTHPKRPRLHMFNGFGAHGSLTIPWYAQRMAAWLLTGRSLPENADIRRYAQDF
jgi:glycine/D-amino acid oxidase-like deaminating enzyme